MQERLAAGKTPRAAKTKTKLVLQVGEDVGIGYFFDNVASTFQRLPQKNDHCTYKPLPASQTLSLLKQKKSLTTC